MKEINNNTLRISDVEKEVTLYGWVQKKRDLGGVCFIDLRDRSGIVQLVAREGKCYEIASQLKSESVIKVVGVVSERESKNKNMDENTKSLPSTSINWYPGHMAKTKREILEKLNLIDVVYEVVDARMPLSSKIVDIDELIKDKPRILVMTKYDLCDKTETDKIIKYYEELGYKVVAVDLMSGLNVKKILDYTKEIMDIENKKRESKGMKPRAARALIVGVPNAGKSTLINRLVGKKSAGVGDTPGFTKSLSWIRINKDVELLDSPGILWPKMEDQEAAHILACLSSIKEEILNPDAIAVFILRKLYELYPERLEERYGVVELDEDLIEVYDTIAKRRGALSRGGVADYDKVSNIIIRDLKNGYFGNITFDRLDVKK